MVENESRFLKTNKCVCPPDLHRPHQPKQCGPNFQLSWQPTKGSGGQKYVGCIITIQAICIFIIVLKF